MRRTSHGTRRIALRIAGIIAVLATIFGVPPTTRAQGQNCDDYDACWQACGECYPEEFPTPALYQSCEGALNTCQAACDRRYRSCSQANVNRRLSKAARPAPNDRTVAPSCLSRRPCPQGFTWDCDHCEPILWRKRDTRRFIGRWGDTCWRPRYCVVCCSTPSGGSYCEFDEGRCGQ